jgi:hypothetical protein
METVRSPKRRFEIVLHGTKPQKTSVVVTEVLMPEKMCIYIYIYMNVPSDTTTFTVRNIGK